MILKLQPDQRIPFLVERTEDVKNSYNNPEVKFVGRTPTDDNAAVHLGVDSVARQLGRIGLTRETIVGRSVIFSATKKGVQKFINIDLDGPAVAAQPPLPAPAAPPAPTKPNAKQAFSAGPALPGEPGYVAPTNGAAPAIDRKSAFHRECRVYEACVDHVVTVTLPKLVAAKVAVTHESTAAQIADLFTRVAELGLDVNG